MLLLILTILFTAERGSLDLFIDFIACFINHKVILNPPRDVNVVRFAVKIADAVRLPRSSGNSSKKPSFATFAIH